MFSTRICCSCSHRKTEKFGGQKLVLLTSLLITYYLLILNHVVPSAISYKIPSDFSGSRIMPQKDSKYAAKMQSHSPNFSKIVSGSCATILFKCRWQSGPQTLFSRSKLFCLMNRLHAKQQLLQLYLKVNVLKKITLLSCHVLSLGFCFPFKNHQKLTWLCCSEQSLCKWTRSKKAVRCLKYNLGGIQRPTSK